jgi:ribosomal protein S18 acetylase RimI-like enzyme
MNFVKVDYVNPLHLECLWKLSKNNNFHREDLRGILYGDPSLDIERIEKNTNSKLPNHIKTKLKSEYQQRMNANLKEYNGRKEYYGLFICKNKKPIGYILYYLRKNDMEVDITFLLVDKNHQNKGYGTILINKLKEIVSNIKPTIYVRIDNNKLEKYYNKFGFNTLDKVLKCLPYDKPNLPRENPNQILLLMTENERNPTKEKKLACVY